MNDTKVKTEVKKERKPFEGIIGQDRAKNQLKFFIESYEHTHQIPHMLLDAAKGQGKTTLAKELARGLTLFNPETGKPEINPETHKPRKKPLVTINAASIKNVAQFINAYVIPFIQDKDVTVFIDEAHELKKDVTNAWLTILESADSGHRTQYAHEEYVCEFDFKRQSFIFATSEVQKVFHALVDRLERVTLEDYSPDQLAKIVQKFTPEVKFKDDALQEVSTVLRGNARNARKMGEKIIAFLMGKKDFALKDWEAMKKRLGIYPLGLSPVELNILRTLATTNEGTSLTRLSAVTGFTPQALRQDHEMYIQKLGLMEIGTQGRIITAKGLDYLRRLLGNEHFRPTGVVQHR